MAKSRSASDRPESVSTPDLAYINASVLSWALNQSSLPSETLAKRLKLTIADLQSWEKKQSLPQFDRAWELARAIGLPFGYLFLRKPPDSTLPIPDFRKRAGRVSNEFRQLLTDVIVKRDWYRDFTRNEGAPRASFVGRFDLSDDVTEVAADIRATLGMRQQLRRSVHSWSDYLSVLARRAENKGVLVMRTSVVANNTRRPISSEEVQGFALADDWAPLVFVNSSDFKAAQIFTFAHELAHLWIAQSAISSPEEGEVSPNAIERLCNGVAAEVLVPEDEFSPMWQATAPFSRVQALAREFWVSTLVILLRAKSLGRLSEGNYVDLRAEAMASQAKAKGGGGNYFRTATVRLGSRLTNAVLGEVAKGRMPLSRASDLLGMRVPTLLKFAETLR